MKIAYIALVITALATCNKAQKMNIELMDTIAQLDTLSISKINYSDSTHAATFYPGYTAEGSAILKKENITALVTALRDTANYSFLDSKNCVMKAQFGFKVDKADEHYIVMLSRLPCMKLSVINRANNSEKTIDLKDNNTILPIVEGVFRKQ